jgi:hypothetical protein
MRMREMGWDGMGGVVRRLPDPAQSVCQSLARLLARRASDVRTLQERGLDVWIYVRCEVSLPAFARSCVAGACLARVNCR